MAQLLGARCGEERQAIVGLAACRLGFERVAYGRVSLVGAKPVHTSMCLCYGDRDWGSLYRKHRYETLDPRLRLALGSILPCRWSIASLRRSIGESGDGDAVHTFLDAMESGGLRTGIVFAVLGPQPYERSIVGLSSSEHESRTNDDRLTAEALMLASCLHEFCRNHVQWPLRAEQASAQLITTQKQILDGLTHGLSARELAAELGLSKHGVDYHLRRLRRHFNVRNRVELVRAALRSNCYRSRY
jgi:DNA-binding CsgD family transcriptional regulator